MDIPLGRIIFTDTGVEMWGRVLYMVVNPPIYDNDGFTVIHSWQEEEDGKVYSPNTNEEITNIVYIPCNYCRGDDLMRLRVVQNNNWGLDNPTDEVTEFNDKAYHCINVCKKEVEKEIRSGKITLLNARDSVSKKRKIEWTCNDEYDSSLPMPDWIIQKWNFDDQQ